MNGVSAFPDDVITDDEINTFLIGGSGTQDGKYRIYSFFLHEHTTKEEAGFLKNEYGTGGRTHALPTADHSYADYDSKGLTLKKGDIFTPDVEVTLTWTNVANRIDSLMADELYMSQEELDYLPRYERQILGADVQQFFSGLPLDMQRPFEVDDSPYPDFWSVSTKIGNTLDNPKTLKNILTAMHPIMENTTNSSRHYNTRKTALENLTAFESGTFTLFPQISAVQADTELPTAETVKEPPMQMTLFPSVVEQMALIEEAAQIETAALPVTITQEDIDSALRQWNGTLESKILVHEYMRENARARDTANFLKTEFEQYGGEMPVFTITKDGAEPVTLTWAKVQRHIGQLMEAGQFLTPEEQAYADRELNDSCEDMLEQEAVQPTDIQEFTERQTVRLSTAW